MHSAHSNPNPPRPPSVERVLNWAAVAPLRDRYGRESVLAGVRQLLREDSQRWRDHAIESEVFDEAALTARLAALLEAAHRPRLKRVFNLTGTVLHTNLGRAQLPESAIEALAIAARSPCALEYDLETGGRGDRDDVVESLLCALTGAEAATVV
ncbi:MAG: hypothetical protein ACFCUJ_12225, partial [Thiotrichales bacterium]